MNQNALCKQGWAFIYSHCCQNVTFRKKHSDDNVRKNYTELITFIFLAQESINMNNTEIKVHKKNMMEQKILMTKSKRFALMKSYLLRRKFAFLLASLQFLVCC